MASKLAERWTYLDRFIQWYRFRIIAAHIPVGCTLTDLGCGTGVFLRYLRERISEGCGIDTSVANNEIGKNIHFKAGNLEVGIPLEDQSVEVVTSLAVLEHLENPEKFVEEIFRILKPGGRCLLTTPSPRAKPVLEFLAYRLKIISEKDIADHKTYFDGSRLRNLFGKFSTVRITYFQCGLNTLVIAYKK